MEWKTRKAGLFVKLQVWCSTPSLYLSTISTTTTCEPDPEEDEMVIPSDKELSDWLKRKCNQVTFQDVNTKLFSEVLPLPEIQQRYMIYCCMSNLILHSLTTGTITKSPKVSWPPAGTVFS